MKRFIFAVLLLCLPILSEAQVLSNVRPSAVGPDGVSTQPLTAPGVTAIGNNGVTTTRISAIRTSTLGVTVLGPNGIMVGADTTGVSDSLWCTDTLGTGSITAGTTASQTIACPNAFAGAACEVGSPATLETGLSQSCLVSASDVVTLRTANVTAGDITPAGSQTVRVHVANPGYTSIVPDRSDMAVHVTWDGLALADSSGVTWTQIGTVPQVIQSLLTPAGAGPYSTSNYYRLGTGVDALDLAGDFVGVSVFTPSAASGYQQIIDTSTAGGNVSGFKVYYSNVIGNPSYQCADLRTYDGAGLVWTESCNCPVTVAQPMVVVVGRDGTSTQYLGCAGLLFSTASPKVAVDAGHGSYMGTTGTGEAMLGTIHEIRFSARTPTSTILLDTMRNAYRKLGAQLIDYLGDSITLAYVPKMPKQMIRLVHHTNDGVTGNLISDMLVRLPAIMAQRPSTVVFMGGTNDGIATPSATSIANLAIIFSRLQAQGIQIIPVTVPPYGGAGRNETTRLAINNWIKAWGTTNGVTVIDADFMGNGAVPPALQAAYDSGDHIHFSTAGYTAFTAVIAGRLNQ